MKQDVNPINLPIQRHRVHFAPDEHLLMRLFPTSACLKVPVTSAVLLGRELTLSAKHGVDFTRFEAHKHGVSRRHAILRRRDDRLTITDLDSTNGTLLNGEQLTPGKEYVVANGDHVSLGTLLIAIFFDSPSPVH